MKIRAISEVVKGILTPAEKIIDKVTTTDEEKSKAKKELSDLVTSVLLEVTQLQSQIIITEAKGNWLQRCWRPILMISFGVVVLIAVFTDTHLNSVPNEFWSLLKIGIGGYVAGRSLEKVTKDITQNIDMPFKRKRDRE